jgi:hypothetical protein
MTKAHITTKAGAKITIEGNPEEVAVIVRQLHGAEAPSKVHRRATTREQKPTARQTATPTNLVLSLIESGFFRKPKDLVAVKTALEEMGHYYPVTTLSPSLLRIVRKHRLRRIKEEKRWLYTG